jgi:hypothetical protein
LDGHTGLIGRFMVGTPLTKDEPGLPCKSVEGHYMRRFHYQRYEKDVPTIEEAHN